jgi:GNAT superfamily N-acetyltransferase
MTGTQLHVGVAEDPDRFLATDHTVWFAEVPSASAEQQLLGLPAEQRFAADVEGADPSTYPGVYGVYPMTLAVPGPDTDVHHVPCAGLTWVGVHPDHRRRGVLTAMMRHHLEQVHETPGMHVSALHASEPAIYGRYGYGLASLEHEVTLGRGTTLTAPHLDEVAAATTTRMGVRTDPGLPARLRRCHQSSAELGSVVGEEGYYARVCQDRPEELRDKEPGKVLFAQRDGADVGFALFRRTSKWERARPSGELSVWALVGDPAARLALLRRLVDFDLMGSVKIRATGVEDPMLLWVGGPRSTSDVGTYDSLWVRLVDLPAALMERSWNARCDVVVGVADRAAPWNEGSWRIAVNDDGVATVEGSTDAADVQLDVTALGAAYLGGRSLVAMHRAGLVAEHRPGAVAELWRAMRTDVVPTAAWMF